MNKLITILVLAAFFTAQAKQLENPDDNTLWMEDGKDIELSEGPRLRNWYPLPDKLELEIKSKENGKGFSFYGKDGNGRKAVTVVNVSPDYPYLVFRITGFEMLKGYRNWTIRAEIGNLVTSHVNSIHKGIFVFDLYKNIPEKEAARKFSHINFWVYNLRLDLEYLKLVKKPDYAVRAECADPIIKPGSKVKFIAELEKEAEDVSVTLTTNGNPRPVKVNGTVKIQLKPTDKTQKIWMAEMEIKSIGIPKAVPRHRIFMKMDVLGGDLDEPVWVGLPYSIAP